MSDEEKKSCNCGELGRFFTLVAAIFIGTLLAILVSAALLRPAKCPCHRFMHMPMRAQAFEQQIPPMTEQWQIKHPGFDHKFNHHNDFRKHMNQDAQTKGK